MTCVIPKISVPKTMIDTSNPLNEKQFIQFPRTETTSTYYPWLSAGTMDGFDKYDINAISNLALEEFLDHVEQEMPNSYIKIHTSLWNGKHKNIGITKIHTNIRGIVGSNLEYNIRLRDLHNDDSEPIFLNINFAYNREAIIQLFNHFKQLFVDAYISRVYEYTLFANLNIVAYNQQ